jgi:hypothetical protein
LDEQGRLRALLDAGHQVEAELDKLSAHEDNPFAKRIRQTCRDLEARLEKLETSRHHSRLGDATSGEEAQ